MTIFHWETSNQKSLKNVGFFFKSIVTIETILMPWLFRVKKAHCVETCNEDST